MVHVHFDYVRFTSLIAHLFNTLEELCVTTQDPLPNRGISSLAAFKKLRTIEASEIVLFGEVGATARLRGTRG